MKRSTLTGVAVALAGLLALTAAAELPQSFTLYDTDCWEYRCSYFRDDVMGQVLYKVDVTTYYGRAVEGLLFYEPGTGLITLTVFEMLSPTDLVVIPSQTIEGTWTGNESTVYLVVDNGWLSTARMSTQRYDDCTGPPKKSGGTAREAAATD
jgi:hypothetical protein